MLHGKARGSICARFTLYHPKLMSSYPKSGLKLSHRPFSFGKCPSQYSLRDFTGVLASQPDLDASPGVSRWPHFHIGRSVDDEVALKSSNI